LRINNNIFFCNAIQKQSIQLQRGIYFSSEVTHQYAKKLLNQHQWRGFLEIMDWLDPRDEILVKATQTPATLHHLEDIVLAMINAGFDQVY